MRNAELLALAGAHGIDLKHLASIEPRGISVQRRKRSEEVLAGVEPMPGRCRRGSQHSSHPIQTPLASDELPWHAARYSFAAEAESYWPLWYALVFQAQRIAGREYWPPQVRGAHGEFHFYLLDLAQLVLDEDASRPLFVAAPQLFAWYMRVERETWQQVLEPRYRSLCGCYGRWLDVARQTIGRWCEEGPQPLCGGELLREMAQTGQRDNGKGNRNPDLKSQDAIPKLEDLGLTKDESSRFQQIAAEPEVIGEERNSSRS
jgi:hypothetical protein